MWLDDAHRTSIGPAVASAASATDDVIPEQDHGTLEELFEIPVTNHLLPIFLMVFVLLTLLLACLYDCKVNRDCCRKRSESESMDVSKTGVYLYDGETGEWRMSGE